MHKNNPKISANPQITTHCQGRSQTQFQEEENPLQHRNVVEKVAKSWYLAISQSKQEVACMWLCLCPQ